MKKFSLALIATAAALAIAPNLMATQITGSLDISGFRDTWNGTSLTFNIGTGATVAAAIDDSGSMALVANDAVIMLPLGWVSNGDSYPVTLNFNLGSDDSSLKATSGVGNGLVDLFDANPATTPSVNLYIQTLGVTTDTGTFLAIGGSGIMTESGYDPTEVTWSISSNDGGNSSSFDVTAVTPEPSSLMLLGTGLLGLAFVAFRKAKASGAVLNM
jgi:hypothetical protein